jgi:hypothetical protein
MYTKTLKLHHHEIPATINAITGEVKQIMQRPNNIPVGREVFQPDSLFTKNYQSSWKYLKNVLTNIELAAVVGMSLMAEPNTNSLKPLDDSTTIPELQEVLGCSKNRVKLILKKLFDLGVYGKFEISKDLEGYKKYWILNPYISFTGKLLESDIAKLFEGTKVHKAFLKAEIDEVCDGLSDAEMAKLQAAISDK